LVRAELNRLGFVEVAAAQAKLAVALQYGLAEKNTTVTEPVYINVHPTWGWRTPYYGYGGAWRGGYVSPTLWANGPHGYQQRTVTFNQARLRVEINQTDGKKLYQANVTSDGLNPTITPAMPYLVKAAFAEFPGKNGVMQRVEIRNDQ
jgi:hypothetical protein